MANTDHGGLKMNKYEKAFFWEILNYLDKTGHKPYRIYLLKHKYILKFTEDIETVAYVKSGLKAIFINIYFFKKWREDKNRDLDAVSMLIRHEILHKAFDHESKIMHILAKQLHLDYDTLDDLTIEQLRSLAYAPSTFEVSIQNIVGDYHISKYYSSLDKNYVNGLDFYGQTIRGLLGERDYPDLDWEHMSFEDIYDFIKNIDTQRLIDSGEYDVEYIDDFEDDEDSELDYIIYIGVINNNIAWIIDEAETVKQHFDDMDTWYEVEISSNELDKFNDIDIQTISEFNQAFPNAQMQEITINDI